MAPAPDLEAVCTACGLCCDGTLFTWVRVEPEELPRLARVRLPVVLHEDERAALGQPCVALEGTRCAVYADRPGACAAYECLLVAALRDREIREDEALSTIREVRERLAALPPLADARHAPGLLATEHRVALRELEVLLDLRFRGRRSRPSP